VADQIKQAIFDGVLKPGDSLPSERELGEAFGVGRPTVREALRILGIMGLIEIGAGVKGSTVKEADLTKYLEAVQQQLSWLIHLDRETINQLWEVRKYVEIGIAHAAAENAGQDDFARLDQIMAQMELCGDHMETYFPLAVEFHKQLALATGNSIFVIVWNMFQDILLKGYTPILNDLFPEGPAGLREANRLLLSAVKGRDHRAIDRAMEQHAEGERLFPRKHPGTCRTEGGPARNRGL
jgi:GntR family transcriptional repressor for pyruvate dehydrogenase complex